MPNDLISRDALVAYVKEIPTYEPTDRGFLFKRYPSGLFAPSDIVKSIEIASAVDAVEVVRCKECVCMHITETGRRYCGAWGRIQTMGDDGYCCFGERRVGDG